MANKKVFVSAPMEGRDRSTVEAAQAEVMAKLQELHPEDTLQLLDNVSPFFSNGNSLGGFGAAVQLMAEADYIGFAREWYNSTGCRMEHQACLEWGRYIDFENFDD